MTSTTTRQQRLEAEIEALREGAAAAEALRQALARVGVVIPSLRGDQPVVGRPMVNLGGCTAEVATALAAVATAAADAQPESRA